MRAPWKRLVDCAVLPGDDPELKLKKRLQVAMAAWSVLAVFGWGAAFLACGRLDCALQPWGYCAATAAMLVVLAVTKRYEWFRAPHTFLFLLGPTALHYYLGGFAASGGAVLWSVIAPVAAMMFSSRAARSCFFALLGLVGAGFVLERVAPSNRPLTPAQASFFFAFNTLGICVFLYLSTRHFVRRLADERARSERLLLNVLPRPIAERLKKDPGIIADRFESVTVLFCFTTASASTPARSSPASSASESSPTISGATR